MCLRNVSEIELFQMYLTPSTLASSNLQLLCVKLLLKWWLVSSCSEHSLPNEEFCKPVFWIFFSRCFAVGSKDMSTWVFGAERWANLIYYALGGHKDIIVACFFEENSLDVCIITQHCWFSRWNRISACKKGGEYFSISEFRKYVK